MTLIYAAALYFAVRLHFKSKTVAHLDIMVKSSVIRRNVQRDSKKSKKKSTISDDQKSRQYIYLFGVPVVRFIFFFLNTLYTATSRKRNSPERRDVIYERQPFLHQNGKSARARKFVFIIIYSIHTGKANNIYVCVSTRNY